MVTALIVDDDADIRALFSTALEHNGFNVIQAGTAREAIALLEQHAPEIAFLDLNMPERSGTEIIAYIRDKAHLLTTKVVVVTANTRADSRIDEVGGADLLLLKPVEIPEMVRLARRLTGLA